MRPIVLNLVSGAVTCLVLTASRGAGADDWRSRQEVWWDNAALVKEAVVAGEVMAAACPAVANDPRTGEALWKISNLLLVFDSMRSKKQVGQMASLVSYYLGEGVGEMYSCIVVRKGALARDALLELKKSGTNECENVLGRNPPFETKRKLCFTSQEMKERIDELLRRIRENSPCGLEK